MGARSKALVVAAVAALGIMGAVPGASAASFDDAQAGHQASADVLGLGGATADSHASKTSGDLDLALTVAENSPVPKGTYSQTSTFCFGFPCTPDGTISVAVASSLAQASAEVEQGMLTPQAAGTYTVTVVLSDVRAVATGDNMHSIGQISAYLNALCDAGCTKSQAFVTQQLACPTCGTSPGTVTLTGTFTVTDPRGASLHVNTGLSSGAYAESVSSASTTASATVSSITVALA